MKIEYDIKFLGLFIHRPQLRIIQVGILGGVVFEDFSTLFPHPVFQLPDRILDTLEFNGGEVGLVNESIRMSLNNKDGLTLSSRTPEQGEAEVRLKLDYSGDDLVIGFNPEFVVDALKVCEDSMTFELKEPSKPGVIKSGSAFKYVVMPVNLS